jgi:hypothetical protein
VLPRNSTHLVMMPAGAHDESATAINRLVMASGAVVVAGQAANAIDSPTVGAPDVEVSLD